MKKIIARLDPDLCDLVPAFLAHKRDDSRAILDGIASEQIDFATLSSIGHKLKGEGGSYGLDAITEYGARIEQAALGHDAEAVRRYANELAAYLDSLEIEYE